MRAMACIGWATPAVGSTRASSAATSGSCTDAAEGDGAAEQQKVSNADRVKYLAFAVTTDTKDCSNGHVPFFDARAVFHTCAAEGGEYGEKSGKERDKGRKRAE